VDEQVTFFDGVLPERRRRFQRSGWPSPRSGRAAGAGAPDTLGTVENLASVYAHQGRYKEAEQLYERALKGREEQLGPEHPTR